MTARRVFLVEDELLVAFDVQDILEEAGCQVEGPFTTVNAALRALEAARPDCAVLDVRLADGEVFPLANALQQAGIPIIFHSGHADESALGSRYPGAAICGKPCSPSHLRDQIARVLQPYAEADSAAV